LLPCLAALIAMTIAAAETGYPSLKAGDLLVQQATNHAWVNRSAEVCRIAFVLIDGIDPLGKTGG
jgi:hypothetical protein